MIGIHGFPDIWQALLFCMYPILLTRMYISVANVQEGDKVIVALQLQALLIITHHPAHQKSKVLDAMEQTTRP